jgi:hypothetical protein
MRRLERRGPLSRRLEPRVAVTVVCWLAIPVAIAWLATVTDVAALAKLFRFVIVSSVACIVAASLCCAACPTRATRAVAGLVMLARALATSDIPQQYLTDGRLIGDRNENWPAVVRIINQSSEGSRWPVVVWPGLIEESSEWRKTHARTADWYLRFPVSGIYQLDTGHRVIIPWGRAMPREVYQLIDENGGAWLIVRGDDRKLQRLGELRYRDLNRRGQPEYVWLRCSMRFVKTSDVLTLIEMRVIEGSVEPWD